MAKILIIIGGHLSTAPRPQKEAQALSAAGHDVEVHGIWFDRELIERDRILLKDKKWTFFPVADLQNQNRFEHSALRLRNRLTKEIYKRSKFFSQNLLGHDPTAMLRAARQSNADLTIVHAESGLWVGSQLLNEGFKVGVDFEDWFSEDLLPEARATRPIFQIKQLETRLIHECKYCLATSHAMAEAMAKAYQAPKPTVVYNAFPWTERERIDGEVRDRKNLNIPSLHWFSQTIGPGRGLENLFHSLPYLEKPVEIHLRGNYPERYFHWMKDLIPESWNEYFFIHPTVPSSELLSRIAEHDIGLALETDTIKNRDLTVTNKLFQYLQAGLAVIATNTAGQREILSSYPAVGTLLYQDNPQAIASAINSFLDSPVSLIKAKEAALKVTQASFNWENEASKLVSAAELGLVN